MKHLTWLGIDPGKTGAVCLLHENGKADFFDYPKSDTVHEMISELKGLIKNRDVKLAFLEQQIAMPLQSSQSGLSTGRNFGRWEGVLAGLEIPHVIDRPQVWQKGVGIKKTDGPDPKARAKM